MFSQCAHASSFQIQPTMYVRPYTHTPHPTHPTHTTHTTHTHTFERDGVPAKVCEVTRPRYQGAQMQQVPMHAITARASSEPMRCAPVARSSHVTVHMMCSPTTCAHSNRANRMKPSAREVRMPHAARDTPATAPRPEHRRTRQETDCEMWHPSAGQRDNGRKHHSKNQVHGAGRGKKKKQNCGRGAGVFNSTFPSFCNDATLSCRFVFPSTLCGYGCFLFSSVCPPSRQGRFVPWHCTTSGVSRWLRPWGGSFCIAVSFQGVVK